jgi:hypothetical protein
VRSLPAVAGVLVLGFALVLFLSTFRQTRTYVHLEGRGGSAFSIEIPRDWARSPTGPLDIVTGRLPSGALGGIALHTARYGTPPGRYADAPTVRTKSEDEIREQGAENGWRRTVVLSLDRGGRVLSVSGRIERGDVAFSAVPTGPGPIDTADVAFLERCLRSMRWIGGPSP